MTPTRVLATALLAMVGSITAAHADCSSEVADAVKKLGQQKSFRLVSNVITDKGPATITNEFLLPDRMRQVVSLAVNPEPVETILIGESAWSKGKDGWKPLSQPQTQDVLQFFQSTIGRIDPQTSEFECLGTEPVDGRDLRAYRGVDPKPASLIPGAESGKPKNEAVRVVYLEPDTGRIARSIYAQAGKLDKPIFKEEYTYADDIKIEDPPGTKK